MALHDELSQSLLTGPGKVVRLTAIDGVFLGEIFMKRLWVLYLFCAVFGFYSLHKAHAMMGSFSLYDARHSVGFYGWELTAGTCLLVAAIGFFLLFFDMGADR